MGRGERQAGSGRDGRLILVIGGAASGKSAVALDLAARGLAPESPRAFVATGEARDGEMAERIGRHKRSRGASWETHEVPVEVADWCRKEGRGHRVILLDCLTLWLSNLGGSGMTDRRVLARARDLIRALRETGARVVVVTNELGLGLVPMEPSARRFRDLAGRVNQRFAAAADEVYVVVAGIALRIKPAGTEEAR
jgi:adenosylcobinamide kinase/adenosylcobinamide-phosphate guanylyltransferase